MEVSSPIWFVSIWTADRIVVAVPLVASPPLVVVVHCASVPVEMRGVLPFFVVQGWIPCAPCIEVIHEVSMLSILDPPPIPLLWHVSLRSSAQAIDRSNSAPTHVVSWPLRGVRGILHCVPTLARTIWHDLFDVAPDAQRRG